MRKISISILVLFVCIAGYSQTIDEFILEQMDLNQVPGLSAVIIIEDSVYWNNNYGYMNLEDSIPVHDSTLFNAFSIGKSVTTSCIMQLWDDGLLGLDQSINDIIPFYVVNPHNGHDSITPRMLMTHTSSFKDWNYTNFFTKGDPSESLANFMANYYEVGGAYYSAVNFRGLPPGAAFYYDNHGIGMLGYLAEPLTGTLFSIFAKDSLFIPLEMNQASWFLDELDIDKLATGYTYSAGYDPWDHLGHPAYPGMMLRSTALELANYDIMLLNRGHFKEKQILSSDAVDSMSTIQNPAWSGAYGTTGLGMFHRGDLGNREVWGHNGGSGAGYAAHMYFCTDENSGVVIMTNSEQYLPSLVEYLFDYALSVQTGLPDVRMNDVSIKIYPNPVNDMLQLSTNTNDKLTEVRVYNLAGQELIQQKWCGKSLDVSGLSHGLYILEARTEKAMVREKFIKR